MQTAHQPLAATEHDLRLASASSHFFPQLRNIVRSRIEIDRTASQFRVLAAKRFAESPQRRLGTPDASPP